MSANNEFDEKTFLPGGILVVDKPPDMSSAAVVRRIKRLPGIRKVGHAGTLDPFATGVLVCLVNQGTRLSQFFLHGRKTYAATLRLGETTDTQDYTGAVTAEKPVDPIPENMIYEIFSEFTGDIFQTPPSYSALKHNGVPLYRHARAGRMIRKPDRAVNISRIEVSDIRLPDITFEVECSGGTYIRTLCADIGDRLGYGGHLLHLDRIKSSGFARKEAIDLERLEQEAIAGRLERHVISMADALKEMPSAEADNRVQEKIRHGRALAAADLPALADASPKPFYARVTAPGNRMLAVIHVPENNFDYRYCCVFH